MSKKKNSKSLWNGEGWVSVGDNINSKFNYTAPVRSRKKAALLSVLIGDLGAMYFYLGQYKKGILCILFCWTGIPSVLGAVNGVRLWFGSDEDFQKRYNVIAAKPSDKKRKQYPSYKNSKRS